MTSQTEKHYLTENPDLMAEWDWEANQDLDPSKITMGSGKKVCWKCKKGHKYEQAIYARVLHPNSCPICSGHRLVLGINDLATTHPKIAKEWHPTKNGNLKPTDVTIGSHRKVWWKCPIGHEYQARIYTKKKYKLLYM